MKRKFQLILGLLILLLVIALEKGQAQQDDRMNRDLRVAENVLATLIKQKFEGQSMFFPLAVTAHYQEGHGVTFALPADFTTPIFLSFPSDRRMRVLEDVHGVNEGNGQPRVRIQKEWKSGNEWTLEDGQELNLDSMRDDSNARLVEACKEFLMDYGDILSQVKDNEKIIITNRNSQPKAWINHFDMPNRTHLSIELSKSDLNQYKKGNLSREKLSEKIKVINTETVDEVEQDLELLSTIFNRLYREDLSTTFFAEGNIYYERLKDFGAIYYMRVYSSNGVFNGTWDMPTQGLHNLSQSDRDKKVKELYPLFLDDLKNNIVEYGRTVKSLAEKEVLSFDVRLTQCKNCGIPASVELTISGADLANYGSGKLDKASAISRIKIKNGPEQ